ncbi:MAG: tetratricopeptide repeat protein, partial [Betaproteobacteria bacterium]
MLKDLADAFGLQQAGRLDEAEAAYAKLLAKTPDDPVALINAGALALARNDLPAALA